MARRIKMFKIEKPFPIWVTGLAIVILFLLAITGLILAGIYL